MSCSRGADAASAASRVGDDRKRVVVDLDELGDVVRRVPIGCGHQRDRLVHEAHPLGREARVGGLLDLLRRLVGVHRHRPRQRDGLRAGQYPEAARVDERRLGADRLDPGVRVRAAHECGEHHARKHDVVDVGRRALDEAPVLGTRHRPPDVALLSDFSHGQTRSVFIFSAAHLMDFTMLW
ncbi:MAG: hypothetical protein M5U08_15120 [Burkholderiales bacterium]|nr:hypothetical protein [Burkholderiales bacterium]